MTPETEITRLIGSVQNPMEPKVPRQMIKAAPMMLEALEIALKEMEYVNRPQSKIAREKARRAILKAGGNVR